VLSVAGIAPYGADGLDWFAGMVPSGVAALGTAAAAREVRAALEASGFAYDTQFTAADLALFEGPWGWLGKVGGPALDAGPYGQIDDGVSYSPRPEKRPPHAAAPAPAASRRRLAAQPAPE
jgi:hypothetical protein